MLITADLESISFVEGCFITNANSVLSEKIERMGLFIRNHHNLPAVANSPPTSDL